MPYNALTELPDAVQKMPKHAQEIYMGAYNGAWEQYKDRGGQREALSHATAWAAVEKQYEKRNGRWVAKESGKGILTISKELKASFVQELAEITGVETKDASMKLSDKNKRNLLQSALVSEYGLKVEDPIPKNLQIEEVFDGELTYNIDGQSYKASYELDENGKAVLGEPEKVLKQTKR